MEELEFVKNFVVNYSDFNGQDKSKYKAIYNPQYHPNGVSFWFNPPFNENGESSACVSGCLLLGVDDNVYIEDFFTGTIYNLSYCIKNATNNAARSIQKRINLK